MRRSFLVGLSRFAWQIALFSSTLIHGTTVKAQTADITRVEETWQMVVGSTELDTGAPQANTVMSPFPHVDSYYGLLTINYRDEPGVTVGGLQAQIWYDMDNVDYSVTNSYALVQYDADEAVKYYVDPEKQLSTSGETVTWTQTLSVAAGTLSFDVQGLQSVTWGNTFVRQASAAAPDVVHLNGYTPDISVEYTRRWGMERDRISSLKITRIRKWDGSGTLVSDQSIDITVLPH